MQQLDMFSMFVDTGKDITNLPEEEMVDIIRNATGIDFKKDDPVFGYRMIMKKENAEFNVHYGYYKTNDERCGQRFISCGWHRTTCDYMGRGGPCDSIDEAIAFFQDGIRILGVSI